MRHLILSTIILLISTVSVFSQGNDSNESSQSNEQNSEKESDNKKQEIDLLFNINVPILQLPSYGFTKQG